MNTTAAADLWLAHLRQCARCGSAPSREDLCPQGKPLYAAWLPLPGYPVTRTVRR
jgi:hypothetical protein